MGWRVSDVPRDNARKMRNLRRHVVKGIGVGRKIYLYWHRRCSMDFRLRCNEERMKLRMTPRRVRMCNV